jgi:hypothetical protein
VDDFQITIEPLEAPSEGRNSNLSKEGGQIFAMNMISKDSFLVSCKQTISQELSQTLSLLALLMVLNSYFQPPTLA